MNSTPARDAGEAGEDRHFLAVLGDEFRQGKSHAGNIVDAPGRNERQVSRRIEAEDRRLPHDPGADAVGAKLVHGLREGRC